MYIVHCRFLLNTFVKITEDCNDVMIGLDTGPNLTARHHLRIFDAFLQTQFLSGVYSFSRSLSCSLTFSLFSRFLSFSHIFSLYLTLSLFYSRFPSLSHIFSTLFPHFLSFSHVFSFFSPLFLYIYKSFCIS